MSPCPWRTFWRHATLANMIIINKKNTMINITYTKIADVSTSMTYIPGTGPQSIFPAARLSLCPKACRWLVKFLGESIFKTWKFSDLMFVFFTAWLTLRPPWPSTPSTSVLAVIATLTGFLYMSQWLWWCTLVGLDENYGHGRPRKSWSYSLKWTQRWWPTLWL